MRILLLLTTTLLLSCSSSKKQMICPYIASTNSDSINHLFTWNPIKHLPQKDGPVIFNWETDSTMTITYTPNLKIPPVKFSKWKVPDDARIHPEPFLLNGKLKLDGTYENNTYKGSGVYFIVYVSKNAVLVQFCEAMALRTIVYYYAKDSVNQLEKAGVFIPFKTSTRLNNAIR